LRHEDEPEQRIDRAPSRAQGAEQSGSNRQSTASEESNPHPVQESGSGRFDPTHFGEEGPDEGLTWHMAKTLYGPTRAEFHTVLVTLHVATDKEHRIQDVSAVSQSPIQITNGAISV
jgi:hypothetical protein